MKGVQFIVADTTSGKVIKKRVGKVWIGRDNQVHMDIKRPDFFEALKIGIPDPVTRKLLTPKDGIDFIYAIPYAYSGTYGWAEYVKMDLDGNVLEEKGNIEGD